MKRKNKFVICSLLIVLLTTCIFTGCTSTQSTQTPVQNNTPPASISSPNLPTTPGTTITTLFPTTASITTIPTTPDNSGITVTLNSAVKTHNVGTFTNKPGNIFLVLDVTIKNNDKNNDFEYTDASFIIGDKTNQQRRNAITSQVAGGLKNPISSGVIPLKSTKTGQIVFGVMDTSNANIYRLFVADSKGTILTSIDNIQVS